MHLDCQASIYWNTWSISHNPIADWILNTIIDIDIIIDIILA